MSDEVIIVYGNKVTRVTRQQYDDVMSEMAGQMCDQIVENMVDQGYTKRRANQTLDAFNKMQGATP